MKNIKTFFIELGLAHKDLYNQMFKEPAFQIDISLSILMILALMTFWGLTFFLIGITISLLNGTLI